MFRALLLDLGGTVLFEGEPDWQGGAAALFAASPLGFETPTQLEEALAARVSAVRSEPAREFSLQAWLAERGGACVEELEKIYFEATCRLSPMADVARSLERIRAAGLAIGAVSNAMFSSRTLSGELDRHNLLGFFDFVISSADLGVRKPSADIFVVALDRIGTAPEDTGFIGDSFENDIEGPTSLGMPTIWIESTGRKAPNDTAHQRARNWPEVAALVLED